MLKINTLDMLKIKSLDMLKINTVDMLKLDTLDMLLLATDRGHLGSVIPTCSRRTNLWYIHSLDLYPTYLPDPFSVGYSQVRWVIEISL